MLLDEKIKNAENIRGATLLLLIEDISPNYK